MALKERGSNNWRKLLKKLQKLKRQQTRQHKDAIHNFTHQITNNYDGIAFEDYKVKSMVDNTQKDKKLFNYVLIFNFLQILDKYLSNPLLTISVISRDSPVFS